MSGWKYYNHAMIPTCAPHENADESALENESFWTEHSGTYLARWTTDFDCEHETNWWYVIRKAPYDPEDVSSKERKSIRQALKKCNVKQIRLSENVQALYDCYLSACEQYENHSHIDSLEQFTAWCSSNNDELECWAGYDIESDTLIGYMTVSVDDCYAEIKTAKFMPQFFNKQASDALYHNVLEYYLNTLKKEYVCSGSRNINHKTNTQQYKIRRFGYKKAYCVLHIRYNPKIKPIIKILFPFRKLLRLFDKITFVHKINGVLLMEEINQTKGDSESNE